MTTTVNEETLLFKYAKHKGLSWVTPEDYRVRRDGSKVVFLSNVHCEYHETMNLDIFEFAIWLHLEVVA